MGIALVSNEVGSGATYKGEAALLSGRAHFLYSDALRGVQTGAFNVPNCHFLYNPNNPNPDSNLQVS